MSEEKIETSEIEVKADEEKKETKGVVEDNIALLRYEKTVLVDEVQKLQLEIDELKVQLEKAVSYIEQDTIIGLVKDIAHRTVVPEEILLLKSAEDLKAMKKTLDDAKLSFKSSASTASVDRSPEAMLNSVFDAYAAETWRKT